MFVCYAVFRYELHEVTTGGIPNRLFFTANTPTHIVFNGTLNFNAQQMAMETVKVYLNVSYLLFNCMSGFSIPSLCSAKC